MQHSFLHQRCWFNYIELQKKWSVGKHVSYRLFGTICWTDSLGNLCKQMMQMDRKRERERKTHRQRNKAPVAVVISSSHIAGTDAFVSPLLSDQDNSIHFYFNSIFWSQIYLNGFILILDYYSFPLNTSRHWRQKQKFVYTRRKCCSIYSEHFFRWTYIHNLKTQISRFPSLQSLQRVCHTWIWREPLMSTVS